MHVFLSYTRNEDQFSKVSQFRDRIEHELSMRSPGATVFQDKKHLREGCHFPDELAMRSRRADVFLAILSPAWFQSDWCRRELALFLVEETYSVNPGAPRFELDLLIRSRFEGQGSRSHRILPVLWVDTPRLPNRLVDPVALMLDRIQHADWRELRYESWDAPASQRRVSTLADSIVALTQPAGPLPRPG